MYVVTDRSTSTVVHIDTLFINKIKYLDIDFGTFFSERTESQREFTDIKISESLYLRPLLTVAMWKIGSYFYTLGQDFEIEVIETLIDASNSKVEIPKEFTGAVEVDFKYIDSKAIICYILHFVSRCFNLSNVELLKRILDLKINTNFSFQEWKSYIRYSNEFKYKASTDFMEKYGYGSKMETLTSVLFSYYSIAWDRKELIKYLEGIYPDITSQQILFDVTINDKNVDLAKEYFFKVEPSTENVRKITAMAYESGSVDIIRFLLNNCNNLDGKLDENAIKTAIKKKDYELVQEIITKYSNTVSISCLEEAVESRDVKIGKLLIEAGVDLKSIEFKGINISIENKDMDMLRLLLENGASVELDDQSGIEKLYSIENHEVAERLLEFFNKDKDKSKTKTPEIQVKVGTRLKFSKTMLCLIEVNHIFNDLCFGLPTDFESFGRDIDLFKNIMAVMNSKQQHIINACALYFDNLSNHPPIHQLEKDCYKKLVKIIGYIVENNLQSTFNDTEYYETNALKVENDIEVLNDRHYELAESELVNRNFGMLKLLMDYGIDIYSGNSLILRTAYKAGGIGWIDYFISKGAKFNGESDGFEEACRSNKVKALEHWIKNGGVVPKNPKYECINMACLLGNFDMVKFLVESGVDLSNPERNGVRIACRLGHKKTLKYLLDNKAVVGNICRYRLEGNREKGQYRYEG
ncbi:putative ankyrin repeat protein L25 [Zancudomyces culisetae]|uniref:Putative ankyrin repeat protein L25 n=1 Tax=Zancudomyces culisetae TaxID=1213189 RepID=A0A1R1PEW0_ZANCU|nr:putative ankyrin repeat protein L25 [Zancudomyces culisetae]|eukprot:OMH79530.1 putative ankyrin repeat protein L25 [Zancudomyces culisetae]